MRLLGEDIDAALDCYRQTVRNRDCLPQDRRSKYDQLQFVRPHLLATVQTQISETLLKEIFITQ